jgi:hypothetical protein
VAQSNPLPRLAIAAAMVAGFLLLRRRLAREHLAETKADEIATAAEDAQPV